MERLGHVHAQHELDLIRSGKFHRSVGELVSCDDHVLGVLVERHGRVATRAPSRNNFSVGAGDLGSGENRLHDILRLFVGAHPALNSKFAQYSVVLLHHREFVHAVVARWSDFSVARGVYPVVEFHADLHLRVVLVEHDGKRLLERQRCEVAEIFREDYRLDDEGRLLSQTVQDVGR